MTPEEKNLAYLRAEKVLAEKIFNVLESFAISIGDVDQAMAKRDGWKIVIKTLENLLDQFKKRI